MLPYEAAVTPESFKSIVTVLPLALDVNTLPPEIVNTSLSKSI